MVIRLEIKGEPIAKKRPRFARRGGYVAVINDQETEEGRFLWEVRQQFRGQPLQGPLSLSVIFRMPVRKSITKRDKRLVEDGQFPHLKKPDLDNLVKFVKDCLNGVAWGDDCQVVSLTARKEYSFAPGTEIVILDAISASRMVLPVDVPKAIGQGLLTPLELARS